MHTHSSEVTHSDGSGGLSSCKKCAQTVRVSLSWLFLQRAQSVSAGVRLAPDRRPYCTAAGERARVWEAHPANNAPQHHVVWQGPVITRVGRVQRVVALEPYVPPRHLHRDGLSSAPVECLTWQCVQPSATRPHATRSATGHDCPAVRARTSWHIKCWVA